jgi:hypothetical protein
MWTLQMGSTHCASQAGPARGSRPAWPFGPRPKSRGALAADVPWWQSCRLLPAGGDGRWGTVARARGGGEGPVIGIRGVGRGSPGAVHGGVARRGEAGDRGGDRWCQSGR